MSITVRVLIGIFIILHGLVHPIMAFVPQPVEQQSDDNPPVLGGFWTKSWLLGDGPGVKRLIYGLSITTAAILAIAGLGFIRSQPWAMVAWLAGAGLSLVTLTVFWNIFLVVGIAIDVLMIVAAFATSWFTS